LRDSATNTMPETPAATMKHIFYNWYGVNEALFHWINGVEGAFHDAFMLFGTLVSSNRNFPYYMTAIAVCALWQVHRAGKNGAGPAAVASIRWIGAIGVFCVAYLLDGLLVFWIKTTLAYPRPPLALPPGTLRILGEPEYALSFPSGHASFAMILVASLWPLLNRGWRIFGVLFVAWVGLSRISVGAHFPVDVVGSYVIALPIAVLVRRGVDAYLATAAVSAMESRRS
jgi:membrane-associated phospholipid phosphatase